MGGVEIRAVTTNLKKTLVEAGTVIRGDMSGSIELSLAGTLIGDVEVIHLSMEPRAHLEGSVIADSAVIKGRVVGSIRAQRVTLSSEADVEGDITCETLKVESGARIVGRCTFESKAESSASDARESEPEPSEERKRSPAVRATREAELLALADRVSRIAG